ncbi:hypothetical protein HHI36_020179 [Cryptolaemus montrouzieri]|uniref:PAS domain-containing protein n=1 Tax=Cryptolaemus montrouzieri TaxID=559131 RepID=A0ABD2N9R6_9CUCU
MDIRGKYKFPCVKYRVTLVLGFLPQELLGSSLYEYFHHDDIPALSECHKTVLQSMDKLYTKNYRFKTKEGGFVNIQSEWRAFRNPWTKETEYFISKNNLIMHIKNQKILIRCQNIWTIWISSMKEIIFKKTLMMVS